MPVRVTERVPGYRDLPLARRARVLGLTALGAMLDISPALAARLVDRVPEPVRRPLQALAGPLRIPRTAPAARLDPARTLRELGKPHRGVVDATPAASIVVPTRGSGGWLSVCLAALAAHTEAPSYEIVVVDDASERSDEIADAVSHCPCAVLVRSERRLGFAGAVNLGVRRARAERLVVLNDDAVVTPGWLAALLDQLEAAPDVGLVGPTSNDTGDVATIPASYDSLSGLCEHATRSRGAPLEVEKLSLFCAALPRALFETLGGLDEAYATGLFEDDDLCMALRRRGLRILLVRNAFVHHAAGATLRRLGRFEYLARFEVNRWRFERRWRVRWRPH